MKRLSRHTVDMAALAERVRPADKPQMDAFRERCQKYVTKIGQFPAEMPKIDWDFYRANVKSTVHGMIDQFKNTYEQLKVPMPADTQTAVLDAQLMQVKEEITSFKAASAERCCEMHSQIDGINAMLPFEQMTVEDYIDTFPNHGPDFLNRPTFWPHNKEEQPGNDGTLQTGVHLLAGEAHLLQQICGLRERLAQRIDDNQRLEKKEVMSRNGTSKSSSNDVNAAVGVGAAHVSV